MSQLLNGRIARTCKRLFSVVALICVAATTLISQQVETIKTEQPVTCEGKQYDVRLVRAAATLGGRNASALAIVLTPNDSSNSRVFGVYWTDAKPLPTHRDDTSGTWKSLAKYGDGQSRSNEPIVNVFFSELKCSTDSQVSGIEKVLATQNLLDSQKSSSLTLGNVAQQLSTYGVDVDSGKVEPASPGNLALFRSLANENDFAQAIRQYVSNLLADGGRTDTAGQKLTSQQQIANLEAKNTDLEAKIKKFDEEKSAFLGAAPDWLAVAFPFMSGLSVLGLIFIGLAVYVLVQRRRSGVSFLSPARTGPPAPSKTSSTSAALTALGEQELTRKLDDLATAVNAVKSNVETVKSSVEQVASNVEKSFAGNSALQDIWIRFYEGKNKPYPRKVPENFTREIGEVIQLYRFLSQHYGRSGDSVVATTNAAQQIVRDLYSVRDNYLSDAVETNARVEQIVSSLSWSLKERSTAQQELKRFYPGRNLSQIVQAAVSSHEAILRETDQISPQQTNSVRERVSALVREYRRLKPKADRAEELEVKSQNLQAKLDTATSELKAGETLVDEIAQQLNFKTDSLNPQDKDRIAATLNRLKTERSSSPYLQLRMGLSSALLAMEKAVSTNGSAQDIDLREALFLNKVIQALRQVLARMEECSGDQLWTNVLYEGFNQQWLHYLIRADLLLRTYYSTSAELSLLRKAVSLACNSILAALHDYHVEIREVELFEKLPPNIDTEPVYPGLRNLPAVIDKVGLMVQNIKVGDVVVDVTSFPVFVKGVQVNRGRAAIANPSAWLQH